MRTYSWLLLVIVAACNGGGGGAPDSSVPDAVPPPDGSGFCEMAPVYVEDVSACVILDTDYTPRDPAMNDAPDDQWPMCISDDNTYHRIMDTISTIARVEAFEQIATLLWEGDRLPSAQDFIDARVIYAVDQGLDSRVQRRQDVHYPAVPAGMACTDPGVPEMYPDRCAGPAKLLPILNDAFAAGATGEAPRLHAARIEAALIWFLYLSPLSEVMSCTNNPQDCDSAWAYYTGGTPREAPIGLSRYVDAIGPETHDRAYDATLAVRCWRNLDNETGIAMDLAMRDRAFGQYDRALQRGVALIVRQRFAELACTSGDVAEARLAFLQIVVPLFDRAARERDAAMADVLLAQAQAATPQEVDVDAALAAIDTLFACP